MPIIRNPFRKQDENVRPATATNNGAEHNKFNGTVSTKPVDIREKEPTEYQLSGMPPPQYTTRNLRNDSY